MRRVFFHNKLTSLWIPFVRSNPLQMGAAVALGFAANYSTLLLTLSIGKYFELVLDTKGGKSRALKLLGPEIQNSTEAFFLFFFVVLACRFLFNWSHQYLAGILGIEFAGRLRDRLLWSKLLQENNSYEYPNKTVLMPFSTDMSHLQRLITKGLLGFIRDLLFVIMAFYVLYKLEASLALIVAVCVSISYVLLSWYNRANRNVMALKRKRGANLWNKVNKMLETESLPSDDEQKSLSNSMRKNSVILKRYQLKKSILNALAPTMLYLILGLIMLAVTLGLVTHQPATADLVTFILLLMTIFPTLRSILKVEQIWIQASLSGKKFMGRENSLNSNTIFKQNMNIVDPIQK